MSNEQAVIEFVARMSAIRAQIDALDALAEDHFGSDPDTLTWANVGDLGRLQSQLADALAPWGAK